MGTEFGDWVITKQFGGPMGDHGGVTCSGLRYRLPSPTSSVVEKDKVIMDNKSSILSFNIATPLNWDMDGGSRAMKGHESPSTLFECSGHHRVGGLHSRV